MSFRCPQCGKDMGKRGSSTGVGQISVWVCVECNVFLSNKEIKQLICRP